MLVDHIETRKRITGIISLVVLIFFSSVLKLDAQSYPFYKYSVQEGLSSSKVYKIIQDRNDYIWLGTESGLTRFDGLVMENYSMQDGLAQGGVPSIYEDRSGLIWLGHHDGSLSLYDGETFREINIEMFDISSDITSIQEYDGKIWITTFLNGAISFSYNKDDYTVTDFKQYRGAEGLSDQVVSSYIDSIGDLYCLADLAIMKFNRDEDKFETYRPEGLSNYAITTVMYDDSHGYRWFGKYNDGLYRMNKKTGKIDWYDIKRGLGSNWISYITEDSRGRVWVVNYGVGISVFTGDEIKYYSTENGLEATEITCLLEDREGNMLIASRQNGLVIFKGDHFVNYNSDRLFKNKNINAINEDKFSRFWFGNMDGVTIYDPDSRLSWSYNYEDDGLAGDVTAIENDLDGNIWLGTNGGGIYKYRFSQNKFAREDQVNEILYEDLRINDIAVDSENNLWIGTNYGVGIWSTHIEEGFVYTQSQGLSGNEITSLFVDSDGYVWVGTRIRNGLSRYNPSAGTFSIIDIPNDLSPKTITQTGDGLIWIGTTYGVMAIEGDTVVKHITEQDGLLSNDIKLLQPDGKGNLYIGTNTGLNSYNLKSGKIYSYTSKNGFTGIQTNSNASIMDMSGNLWFGTVNGVTKLIPDLVPEVNREPLTHIKGLTVNLEPRSMIDGMKLSYKEKSLVFDYYSICLTNPEVVRYKVMLEGAEPDWSPETEITRATYPSLSPGRYTFKVKAVNSSGVWNTEPETFSFIIKPPFYFSPLFILSMAVLLIIGIWVFIKVRERNLIIEKQILEDKVEERTAEVVEKSKVIEEKNRDITASIRYAERIQMAMLPPEDGFEDTFVLFMPKDIVSGDFYWMYDNGDVQFLAAVDCTGHGVPGAFMSIIGSNSLTKIVREYGILRPSAILDQLNMEVTKSLVQRGETVINDGMDLALISFDKKNKKVEFAGAYNPLVIVRDGEHITVKADRFPIGMSYAGKRKFTNNEVEVKSGDMLYMFSDGYADQFGGPDTKKFKVLNLKNEFLKINTLPVEAQKDHLLKIIQDWMGDCQQQIDDILVIGTRVP